MLTPRDVAWAILRRQIHTKFPDVQEISTVELADVLNQHHIQQPVLLDTRTEAEYDVSHLWDAQRIEPKSPDFNFLQALPKDTPIVTYCSVGYRSAAIASQLQTLGFTHVLNLQGSIFLWANQGKPVYRGTRPVQAVHPYNSLWGLLLKSSLHTYESDGE